MGELHGNKIHAFLYTWCRRKGIFTQMRTLTLSTFIFKNGNTTVYLIASLISPMVGLLSCR